MNDIVLKYTFKTERQATEFIKFSAEYWGQICVPQVTNARTVLFPHYATITDVQRAVAFKYGFIAGQKQETESK